MSLSSRHVGSVRLPLLLVQLLLVLVSLGLLAAHFLRQGQSGLAISWALAPLLLLQRKRYLAQLFTIVLAGGAVLWLHTLLGLLRQRQAMGQPWALAATILGAAALLALLAAWSCRSKNFQQLLWRNADSAWLSTAAFLLTFGLLAAVQLKVQLPMLLLERAFQGGGWVETLLLASYAAWAVEKLFDPISAPAWRRRIWLLFSLVFFAQLGLGLLGFDQFLMRPDRLHFPIPALIVAGPIYRGGGLFMLILFLCTVAVVGPAWCSHLCYLGAWDQLAADSKRKPKRVPHGFGRYRVGSAAVVIGAAVLLRLAGASLWLAASLALALGLIGVAVILLASRRKGLMVHCTVFCPVGLVASLLGKLSPFRLRIGAGCDGCMRCRLSCRYGALEGRHIDRGRPGLSCTLCGDCLASCASQQLHYGYAGLPPGAARSLFLVLVIALHAATLGLARI